MASYLRAKPEPVCRRIDAGDAIRSFPGEGPCSESLTARTLEDVMASKVTYPTIKVIGQLPPTFAKMGHFSVGLAGAQSRSTIVPHRATVIVP